MGAKPEIVVARTAGFCSGVHRAITTVRKLLGQGSPIYCLGDIIHNRRVVDRLKESGMKVVESLAQIPPAPVCGSCSLLIRTHGLPLPVIRQAEDRGLDLVDLTCPKVKKIHRLVGELSAQGYYLYIVGDARHPEVQAITSLAGRSYQVLEHPSQVEAGPDDGPETGRDGSGDTARDGSRDVERERPCAVVVQTTFNPGLFYDVVRSVVALNKRTLVCNTLCEETIRRQREAARLAGEVDLMLVVGGRNSSNTKTLYTLVRERVRAAHIEGAHELHADLVRGAGRIGIISGASTPREEVNLVQRAIEELSG
ncbi:MAG: 4-hydroxy-3-methylbut-2-enyl diphosphate reductase [Spirochaetota bacterium]